MEVNNVKKMIYQMFILGLDGENISQNLNLQQALKNGLGGVIFFTKNIQSFEQIKKLTDDIKNVSIIPPFLAIDQEGGRVERSENIFNGKKYKSAKFAYESGLDFLKIQTEQISNDLLKMGMNLNFAPCIDVNTNPSNPIIGERAFSSDTNEVIEAGKLVVKTYLDNNIIPCTKHFPGHGDANADSHLELPVINLSKEEMEKFHIRPFREVKSPMIMVAHLHIPFFDENPIPSSLSVNTINYLKQNLDYDPILITDDMVMGGVLKIPPVEACIMSIKAGVNIILYRNSDDETIKLIETIAEIADNDEELIQKITESFNKIEAFKEQYIL